jgi:hypothetical protein
LERITMRRLSGIHTNDESTAGSAVARVSVARTRSHNPMSEF